MVEKIITWLLEKAGVLQRIAQLEERIDRMTELPVQTDSGQPGQKKLTPADIINEWLNGGVQSD